jgi:hypothetical protein
MGQVNINTAAVMRTILITLFILFIANTAVLFISDVQGHKRLFGLVRLFNFNSENNLPTLFSFALILFNAFLFILLSRIKLTLHSRGFSILAFVFLFLAFDEMFSIHEMTIIPIRDYLGASGIFYFAWIIPYFILGAVLLVILIPLLINLPKRERNLYMLSGTIFITGAIVIEMFEGRYYEATQAYDLTYHLFTTSEELLEMLGMTLCIYTSLSYLETTEGYKVKFLIDRLPQQSI